MNDTPEILPAQHPGLSRNSEGRLTREVVPVVGMACTMPTGSDSHPGTVIEVARGGRRVLVQRDRVRGGPGHNYYGSQNWVYSRNPHGKILEFSLRKDGSWIQKGVPLKSWGYGRAYFGNRRAYQNPSF